jgi:hypothetical protein
MTDRSFSSNRYLFLIDRQQKRGKVNHGGDHIIKTDPVKPVIAEFFIDTCPGGVKLWPIQIPRSLS